MLTKNAVQDILCCKIAAQRYNVLRHWQLAKHIGIPFRVQSVGSISGLTTFCVDFA